MVKSYNNINNRQINKAKFLKFNFYIIALRYLKKKIFYFIELIIKNKDKKENKNNQKLLISDLKKEIKKNIMKKKS